MANTIDMQGLRYLNLFEKITNVNTRHFFKYNNMLVFCVPKNMVFKAIGEDAKNLRKMSEILGRKIKVVAYPKSIKDAREFIETIISPTTFKDLEFNDNEIIVNAGRMSKAALIGRDKRRLNEMQEITQVLFKKDYRVV